MGSALGRARQLVRALPGHLLGWASAVRAAIDRAPIDPELERLAERAFSELRQAPLVRPSRDIAESVKQRLQQRAGGPPATPTDEGSAKQD